MDRAVFLDRDGVITQEPPYYAHKLSDLKLIPGSAKAIRLLNEKAFKVIVVSNQAGIARGYYGEEDAEAFNRGLKQKLAEEGAYVDAIYYCPHHPEAGTGKFRVDCDCRKPRPGMLAKAKKELGLAMDRSFMVGDKQSDIEAGKRAGCTTIMVRTGQGDRELKNHKIDCDRVAADLCEAVEHILSLSDWIGITARPIDTTK